jgi:uncharacterized membrane protein
LLKRRSRIEFQVSPATFETIVLASIAGLRSMSAPAFLSRAIERGDLRAPNLLPALGSPKVSALLSLLGATLFASEGRNGNSGAILGVICAVIAAYAGEGFRSLGARKGIPDPILATLEDMVVLTLGKRILRRV